MSPALALLWAAVSAAPLGPCADPASCTVRLAADAPAELLGALESLGLGRSDPGAVEPLSRRGGDRAFSLEAAASGGSVRVRVASLHRPPWVWGEGTRQVVTTGARFKQRAAQAAWRVAAQAAFADLEVRIAEALGQGVRKVRLSLRVNGLEPAARQQAQEKTLPCLKGRLDLVGAATTAELRGGFLEEELEYAPAPDEPREPLEHHVAWVKAALLGGPRAACSLLGTPLGRHTVLVSSDAVNRGVVIAFER